MVWLCLSGGKQWQNVKNENYTLFMLPQRSAQNWRAWLGYKVMKKSSGNFRHNMHEKGRRKIKDCPCIRSSSLHFMATERENLSTEQGSEVPATHMNVLLCKWYESQGKFSPTAIRQLKRRMENGENTACAFYATPRNNIVGVLSKPFLRQIDLSKAKC